MKTTKSEIMNITEMLDTMTPENQTIVNEMSNAISAVLRANSIRPLQDDRGATLDAACAVYLNECLEPKQ